MTATEPFIVFAVAGTSYALRSRDVAHVEMLERVTAVPNAASFVDGAVFSRGEVVPAVNLRARFGFERAPYDLATRLLIVRGGGRTVGLIADNAREFVAIDPASIQAPPAALSGASGRYLEGVANVGDRLILLLKLDEMLDFEERVQSARS